MQDVYSARGAGVVPAGRVEAGAVRPGMALRVLPGDFKVTVKGVQEFKKDISEATAGKLFQRCGQVGFLSGQMNFWEVWAGEFLEGVGR